MAKEYTKPDMEKIQMDFELSDRQKEVLAAQAREAAERAKAAMMAAKQKAPQSKEKKDPPAGEGEKSGSGKIEE